MYKRMIIMMVVFSALPKLEAHKVEVNKQLSDYDSSVLFMQVKKTVTEQGLIEFLLTTPYFGDFSFDRVFPNHNDNNLSRLYKVHIGRYISNHEKVSIPKLLLSSGLFEYVEYAVINRTYATPNDLHVNQWHLKKIFAEQSWDIQVGVSNIKIAIVDDAIDINHPDLKNVIYVNSSETAGNGIDDDGNGYVDDVYGWNANYKIGNPNPPFNDRSDFTHGTHCAGIAAAQTNNNLGIASIGYNISIIPVACFDSTAPGRVVGGYEGIVYAADAGAKVISLSWGGSVYSSTGQIVIDYAVNKGIVICAAAGNANVSNKMYPAAFNGVIAIAASDNTDKKASFSNYGNWIDISAPGVDIWSSVTGFSYLYDYLSGTSMACPLTAGLCALMLSKNKMLTPAEIEQCLKSSADNINSVNPSYNNQLGAGRINAQKALQCVKPLYTDFTSNKKIICENEQVQFTYSGSSNAISYLWKIAGANPISSTLKNPIFTFTSTGFYDVKLRISDGVISDSIEYKQFIEVRPVTAKIINSTHKIKPGGTAFITVELKGVAPWDLKISDGLTITTYNNIQTNSYYFDVSPLVNSKYYISEVNDSRCIGIFSDTAYVVIDSSAQNGQDSSCGKFDLISKVYDFGSDEIPNCIYKLKDGNFAIVGLSNKGVIGGNDIFLTKINRVGDIIWTKYYGTNGNETGTPIGIAEDDLFNIYIYGGTTVNSRVSGYICKIDSAGTILFSKASAANNVGDHVRNATKTSNGNMVFVGTSAVVSDQAAGIFLTNLAGTRIWGHSFNSSIFSTEHFIDVTEIKNKLYALGHTSIGNGQYGTMLVKMDLSGNTMWQKYIDFDQYDAGIFMEATHQNSLMTVEWISSNGISVFGSGDVGIVHCDTNGNKIWSKVFGLSGKEEASGLLKVGDKYYISGITQSFDGGNTKLFLMKMDINGNVEWTKIYGDMNENISKSPFGRHLALNSDGSILLMGVKSNANSDIVIYKIDECGNSNCYTRSVSFLSVNENAIISNSNLQDPGLLNNNSIGTTAANSLNSDLKISSNCPTLYYKPLCKIKSKFNYEFSCLKDSVKFIDSSIHVSNGKIIQYKWIFHDGSSITGKQYSAFKYNTIGTYPVSLIVYADTPSSCSDTFVKNVQITNKVSVKLNYTHTDICLYDSVRLYINQICGEAPYTIQWFPSQFFSKPNSLYTSISPPQSMWVKYSIRDRINNINTDSVYINVNKNCCQYQAAAQASKSTFCLGERGNIVSANNNQYTGAQNNWFIYINDVLIDSVIATRIDNYQFKSVGKYTFKLRITGSCLTSENSVEVFVYPLPIAEAGKDTVVCNTTSVNLGMYTLAQHRYSWTPNTGLSSDNISNPSATINETIRYYLTVTDLMTGCKNIDSITLERAGIYEGIGSDTSICQGEVLVLNAGNNFGNPTFTWNDGSNGPSKSVKQSGRYILNISDRCGVFSDTVDVFSKVCFCELFLPNAFSPNANAINDYFPEHYLDTIIDLQIFNRWGEKIYDKNGSNIGWDGRYQGEVVQQDVYLYIIRYRNCYGRIVYKTGTFTLLR